MLKKLLYISYGVHCTGQRQTNIIAAVEQFYLVIATSLRTMGDKAR